MIHEDSEQDEDSEQEEEEESEEAATEDDEDEDSRAEEDNAGDEENEEGDDEEASSAGKRRASSSGYDSRKRSALQLLCKAEDEGEGSSPPGKSPIASADKISHKESAMVAMDISLIGGEPIRLSPLINQTLDCIRKARHRVLQCPDLLASSPACIPGLHQVRSATLSLLTCTDDTISCVHTRQARLEKKALEQELATAQNTLNILRSEYTSQVSLLKEARSEMEKQKINFQREKTSQVSLLKEARSEMEKQKTNFQRDKTTLQLSHDKQKTALLVKQRALERQLEEEKDKSICCVCHEKPRDTIILPCLHFQYCFSCILRHREVSSNTCPSCRGPIKGLNMSSFLAGQ